jgi:hypothetical protein
MLTAAGSVLVGHPTSEGDGMVATGPKTRWVKVVLPFYIEKVVQEAGKEIELERGLAATVVAWGKAHFIDGPTPGEPAPGAAGAPPKAKG